MFFRRKKKRKKQEVMFIEALQEVYSKVNETMVAIDHPNGKCFYGGDQYEVIFPLRFLKDSRALSFRKQVNFNFRGIRTEKRDWVMDFAAHNSIIDFTNSGRLMDKGAFDFSYYQNIAHSKYTLCPAGDFKWTYRFLEAVLCLSVPVIERNAWHPQCEGFYFRYSDEGVEKLIHDWDTGPLMKNYRLFLNKHTLLSKFVFMSDAVYE